MYISTDNTETKQIDTQYTNIDIINIVQPLMGPGFDPEKDIIDFSDSEDEEINDINDSETE